jgi:hypothetical protein
MNLLIAWAIVLTTAYLMSKWVERNNIERRKRTSKENYIYYLNKEKKQ